MSAPTEELHSDSEDEIIFQGRMQVLESDEECDSDCSCDDDDVSEALQEQHVNVNMMNELLKGLGIDAFSESVFANMIAPKKPKIVYVTIEGNIGSGKSTMIGHIRERFPEYRIVDEPVHIWQALKDETGRSLLELFYTDKKRWSYTFQSSAFITRIMGSTKALNQAMEDIMNGVAGKIVILSERSILTDRHVFASMLKADGDLNPLEWELYTYWFDHFSKDVKLDGIVYVTTDSLVCKDRIKIRGRQGEEGIPQEYLDELTKYHEQWLSTTELPVLRISSNVSELGTIEQFINELLLKED